MKNILIISYFYPPCTLTAAQRPAGWVKYLHEFGFRPIIITRNWDVKISKPEDQLKDTGKNIEIDSTEKAEIHYLPYKASIRDRIFNSSNPILKKGSKILTLLNSVGENYSNRFIPFSNFYQYACLLIEEKKIDTLLISANPFIQFRFGYLLHKKYAIKWIADYRDDWTTSEIIKPKLFVEKLLYYFHRKSEIKWVQTATLITSVSDVYTNRISHFVGVKGTTILNGFDELYPVKKTSKENHFVITYNGTIYDTQNVEGFIASILKCINYFRDRIFIRVQFPGVAYDQFQLKRIELLIKGYENHFLLTDRIPKNEVIEMQRDSDVLLMLTHIGVKGISSSKLYEYLAIQKLILCFPSDQDIVEQTLKETELGIILNDDVQLLLELYRLIENKIKNGILSVSTNEENLKKYSIRNQCEKLAVLLQKMKR